MLSSHPLSLACSQSDWLRRCVREWECWGLSASLEGKSCIAHCCLWCEDHMHDEKQIPFEIVFFSHFACSHLFIFDWFWRMHVGLSVAGMSQSWSHGTYSVTLYVLCNVQEWYVGSCNHLLQIEYGHKLWRGVFFPSCVFRNRSTRTASAPETPNRVHPGMTALLHLDSLTCQSGISPCCSHWFYDNVKGPVYSHCRVEHSFVCA